jgi:hypothetical protein
MSTLTEFHRQQRTTSGKPLTRTWPWSARTHDLLGSYTPEGRSQEHGVGEESSINLPWGRLELPAASLLLGQGPTHGGMQHLKA